MSRPARRYKPRRWCTTPTFGLWMSRRRSTGIHEGTFSLLRQNPWIEFWSIKCVENAHRSVAVIEIELPLTYLNCVRPDLMISSLQFTMPLPS